MLRWHYLVQKVQDLPKLLLLPLRKKMTMFSHLLLFLPFLFLFFFFLIPSLFEFRMKNMSPL